MKFFMGPHIWDETVEDIVAAGHERVDDLSQADVFVFTSSNPEDFPDKLPDNIQFVQHCFTGVEGLIDAGLITEDGIPWANTAGAFATPVAEMGLMLLLAQAHRQKEVTRAASFDVAGHADRTQQWLYSNLHRGKKKLVIFGAGGIGKEFIRLIEPFDMEVIAVNRSGREVEGADQTVKMADADALWETADIVVLVLPLTEETEGIVDAEKLTAMKNSAILVNIGRGKLINTDDLVEALKNDEIAGAALEVTDPEPLPDDHPLWAMDNCTISPHIGASFRVARLHVGKTAAANMDAFERGEEMPTQVDPSAGY